MPKMKAIQVTASGTDFKLVNIEIPEPRENEVLIKVEACGVKMYLLQVFPSMGAMQNIW